MIVRLVKKKNIEPSLIKPKILVQIFTENTKENDKKKPKKQLIFKGFWSFKCNIELYRFIGIS